MKLLIASLILFLAFSSLVMAQSFKDKVIFSPDVAFLWNFQRGVEEIYRIVKFTSAMRIDYSLELGERRIGEMEVLISKNKTDYIPITEMDYEMEINKITTEMNTTDILSKIIKISGINENVTERLEYDNTVLDNISSDTRGSTKNYIENAIKKTSDSIDFIKSLR